MNSNRYVRVVGPSGWLIADPHTGQVIDNNGYASVASFDFLTYQIVHGKRVEDIRGSTIDIDHLGYKTRNGEAVQPLFEYEKA